MDDRYSSTRKIPNVCCCPSSMIPFFLSVLLEQRSRERNGRDGLGWTLLQEGKNLSVQPEPISSSLPFLWPNVWPRKRKWPTIAELCRSLGKNSVGSSSLVDSWSLTAASNLFFRGLWAAHHAHLFPARLSREGRDGSGGSRSAPARIVTEEISTGHNLWTVFPFFSPFKREERKKRKKTRKI